MLEKRVGLLTHGPSNPERSAWQRCSRGEPVSDLKTRARTYPKVVGSGERDNLLVIEAHLNGEDLAKVVGGLSTVRQASARRALRVVNEVGAARLPFDLRAAHLLDGDDACEGPQICSFGGVRKHDGLRRLLGTHRRR